MRLSKAKMLQGTAVLALFTVSAVLNIALAYKVKSAQRAIEILKAEGRLHSGARVPNIEGKTPDGKPITINFAASGKPTILYVFTPSCHWCQLNLENMLALSRSAEGRYAFVGVSLSPDGVVRYMKEHGIQYPVITSVPEPIKAIYKMRGTPTTIIVSTDNKVLNVWNGAYDSRLQTELETYFHTRLPGLSPPQTTLAEK